MIFVYTDETGNRGRRLTADHDWLYVLTAVTLFDKNWHGFEKTISGQERSLLLQIESRSGVRLELADCESKSNWLRIPKERKEHPFLGRLEERELTELVELYYHQLEHHKMHVFAVLIDKRELPDYMDHEKIHRKSWELLVELIERFMAAHNNRHQALMICDDIGPQVNRSLAMKHAYLKDQGTRKETRLFHICEMPMFVRSELSNGVQLADLCSYNIYRAFSRGDLSYPFFRRIAPFIWCPSCRVRAGEPFSGLYVMPGHSSVRRHIREFEEERALEAASKALNLVSSGANPIEPTGGTGQNLRPRQQDCNPGTGPLVNNNRACPLDPGTSSSATSQPSAADGGQSSAGEPAG